MGNFDFKAFVAQQKEDARQEKEQRIIKESKEHRTFKGLLEGHAAQDILLGFSANNSKIKISEREFDLVCNRLFDDLRESEEQESKSLIKESNKNYYEQLVKEYISQKKNIPIQEIQLNEGLWDFVKKITKKVGNAIEAEKTDLFGGIPREEQEKFEKIINQASSQEIKGIASVIKNEAPDFPNNVCDPNDEACTDGGELQFKSILAAFEVVYDSLNERSQKWCQDPDIQDGLDPKSAEALISKLRYLLRFYLDRKLKDKYRYVKEEQEEQEADLVEEQEFFKELRESINTLYNQDMILEAAMMPGNLGIKGDRGRQPNQIGGGADEEYKKAEEILGSPELAKAWYQIDIAFREAGKSAGFPPQNLKVAIQAYAKQGKDAEYVVDLLLQNAASAKEKNQVSDGDTPMDQLQTWKKYRKWKVTDKPGQITGEYDADGGSKVVMKSLRSHKLPMFLLGLASMMGAFGWLAKTPLFKDWIKDYFSTIIQTGKEAIPGKDVIKTFSESVPMKTISELGATSGGTGYWQALGLGDFSDGAPALETLKRAAMEVGDNVQDGLSNMSTVFANPEARQALLDRVAYFEQTNPGVSFGEFFPDGSENTGLWLVHPGSAMVKTITTKMVVGTAKGVAATAIKATLGGSILMALGAAAPMVGVGALVSALGVGLLRLKGRRDSRAQLMNDLLKKMKTPEDCIEDPPPVTKCPPGETWDGEKCVPDEEEDQKCPPGETWDGQKCVPDTDTDPGPGPGPGPKVDDKDFTIPNYGKGKTVEAFIRKFARKNKLGISTRGLEEFLEVVEKWMGDVEKTHKDNDFLNLREDEELNELSPIEEPEPGSKDSGEKKSRLIYVKKNRTRSSRGKSLRNRIIRLMTSGAGTGGSFGGSPFKKQDLDKTIVRKFANEMAKFIMDDLKSQGAEVQQQQQQQQQQESKRRKFGKILKTINEKLIKSNKKPINERQLAKYLKSRKKKLLK